MENLKCYFDPEMDAAISQIIFCKARQWFWLSIRSWGFVTCIILLPYFTQVVQL